MIPNEPNPGEPSDAPQPMRRRMTKAEREKHEAELATISATLGDLEDEKAHRRRNTRIGGVAIFVTALFSLASCAATNNEIETMDRIAAQEQARDRDQLRLRCAEQMAATTEPLFALALTLFEADASAENVPAAAMLGPLDDYASAAAVCSAAGMTEKAEKERFSDALTGMISAADQPLDNQVKAFRELNDSVEAYIDVDIMGVGAAFETDTDLGGDPD